MTQILLSFDCTSVCSPPFTAFIILPALEAAMFIPANPIIAPASFLEAFIIASLAAFAIKPESVVGSNPKDTITYEDVIGTQLKTKFIEKITEAISIVMRRHKVSFGDMDFQTCFQE